MHTNRVGTDGGPIVEVDAGNYPASVLSELLCCPFCGANAFIWQTHMGLKVSCSKDCITMPPRSDMGFTSKEQAIEYWNKRAT